MNIQIVQRWHSLFMKGREDAHDEQLSRRLTTTRNDAIAAISNIVEEDQNVITEKP